MSRTLLLCALVAGFLGACDGDGAPAGGNGTGLTGLGGLGGIGGNTFNQCGVAAPPPAETGQCTTVTAPAIADFDDYVAGAPAGSYTYYVNGKPPAAGAQLGAILHVGDGSDMNGGTSVVATEMVTGAGATGYALQISNTNATTWGGLLMFYFISGGATPGCVNAQAHGGVEFSIRGSSPSRRFAVSVGMIDTIPAIENGLCDNANVNDCRSASIEMPLPVDAAAWTQVQLPWSALTPGVGSGLACVPVTGQNIVRLVIQPLMRYPPPNYTFEAGPYAIAVDNVRFF